VAFLGGGNEVLELAQLHRLISMTDGSKLDLLLDSIVEWRDPGRVGTTDQRTDDTQRFKE